MKLKTNSPLSRIIIILTILIVGVTAGFLWGQAQPPPSSTDEVQTPNKYVTFLFEIYELVEKNYWDKIDEKKLVQLYVQAIEKITVRALGTQIKNKSDLADKLVQIIEELDENKQAEFTTTLADIVLANLSPFGRSRLYSQQDKADLENTIENKNLDVNQYQVLAVEASASAQEIDQAFQEKSKDLEQDQSEAGQLQLAELNQAYRTLSDTTARQRYDKSGVETTIENRLVNPEVLYLHLLKFSPTTMDDLVSVSQKYDQGTELDSLIIDLRDNVGGAIDGLPYFLGPFIGNNQYAYQFFHQGEPIDFKTKVGWLPSLNRYKKIVILVNEQTQSSAEVMAATLKKYNVGVVLGSTTKGWGSVEKVFPLDNQLDDGHTYSVFLVHSLTLREDGQPIEGSGVEPHIFINESGWEKQFGNYFDSPVLLQSVQEVL